MSAKLNTYVQMRQRQQRKESWKHEDLRAKNATRMPARGRRK